MWRRLSIAAATLVAISCPLATQAQDLPKYHYWEVTPLFGYRTNISFATDAENDVPSKITFEGGAAFGLAFGGRINDEDVIEFRWTRQDAHVRFSPELTPSSQLKIDQFHLDFSHEYEIEEWPRARPYVMASIGMTRFSGTATFGSFTRFSFGMGGGLKVFPTTHVGLKVQAQWLPVVFNPQTTAYCVTGCVIRFGGKLGSQAEVTAGPVFRF